MSGAADRTLAGSDDALVSAGRALDVTVLGAGVIGLVCALRLVEAGHRVRVVAADRGARTTSAVAAALWYPYRAAPQEKVTRWSAETFRDLASLAAEPAAGVRMRWGRELFRVPTADPCPCIDCPEPEAEP